MPELDAGTPNQAPPLLLRSARALTLRLRRVRGGVLIGEALRRIYGTTPRVLRVSDFDGTLKLDLDLSEHMQSQIFWHGFYSLEVAEVLRRTLRTGDTFLDCGANIGELTLLGSKLVGDTGRVFAFEPLDDLADQLDRHLAMNQIRNVEVQRVGVSAKAGTSPIFVAAEAFSDGTRHRGLATLFQTPTRGIETATIDLVSIDDFVRDRALTEIRLIKLDIEGAELPAIEGAQHTLRQLKPFLIVEIGRETCESAGYEPKDIASYIVALGYRLYRIGRRGKLAAMGIDDLTEFQNIYCVPNGNSL